MKRNLSLLVLGLLVLSAVAAFAATDVTGTWTSTAKGDNGEDFVLTFIFKQDGAKLTGSVTGPQGNAIDISDGTVDGDKVSFKVSFNGATINHDGVIKGDDEISLKAKADQGDFPEMDMTLKRVK